MSDTPIGFAIVGAGMVARYHAQAIAATPGARVVALCRSDPARAAETEREFGVPCDPSLEALLARREVDVVCLASPSGLHAGETLAAARARKHVLVEKPMALTVADADAMIAACREAGVQLGVFLQRRADPTFQAVRAAIVAEELGRLVMGTASVPYFRNQGYYDSAAWRGTRALDGGGALMNQGIHLVDLLLWFMGDVAEVSARSATLTHSIEVEDGVAASVRFESGALGGIVATTSASPGFPHRVEVYGTRGGIQIEGESVVRWDGERSASSPAITLSAPAGAGAGGSPTGISAIGHTRLVADFVAAIREGRDPLVPGSEGRRSLALVLAVYEAARSGRTVRPGE